MVQLLGYFYFIIINVVFDKLLWQQMLNALLIKSGEENGRLNDRETVKAAEFNKAVLVSLCLVVKRDKEHGREKSSEKISLEFLLSYSSPHVQTPPLPLPLTTPFMPNK